MGVHMPADQVQTSISAWLPPGSLFFLKPPLVDAGMEDFTIIACGQSEILSTEFRYCKTKHSRDFNKNPLIPPSLRPEQWSEILPSVATLFFPVIPSPHRVTNPTVYSQQ